MTNFDFLKEDPQFSAFADVAIAAENILHIDVDACVLNCRRAMEFAVKWMYSVDRALVTPYRGDTLVALMTDKRFKELVGKDMFKRMEFIRKVGNNAAHSGKKVTKEQAELCLENLFYFMDEVACFYADNYTRRRFNRALLTLTPQEALDFVPDTQIDLDTLMLENRRMKAELTARRAQQQSGYVPAALETAEYGTRKIYIDFMLQDAGWTEGKDRVSDLELYPDGAGSTCADCVLYGDDGIPLAVLEARLSCTGFPEGRQQAEKWADALEKIHGRRPVIFLTNGFETRIIDGLYPDRRVASVYSKRDLEKLLTLRTSRVKLNGAEPDRQIAGRYYQVNAVKAVCRAFGQEGRRKALLVMAAGSGKTRTVMALCGVLLKRGWIKNVLFLADREPLVTQAMRGFRKLLPGLPVSQPGDPGTDMSTGCVFSTYQAMMDVIDTARDSSGRIFTCGHFDLVICDEAHRSVYQRYRDVFGYFDSLLVGLTATPAEDLDDGTYEAFGLENGRPTFLYDTAQAVADGYLIDFVTVDTDLKFAQEGAAYDDLSGEDREVYEDTFTDEDGRMPEGIVSPALNDWISDDETIKQALHILMDNGLRIRRGTKLGKTIVFARDHSHAERITDVFKKEYPLLQGFARVIDSRTKYAQKLLDEFSDPEGLPQIAVSVDMLETGINVPEVLNLVFLKKVASKALFRQMIGRGARLCRHLLDGQDKEKFYVFDFCGNFEFFRMDKGHGPSVGGNLQAAVFRLKANIAYRLQDPRYSGENYRAMLDTLIGEMARAVGTLNRGNFAVRQHLEQVERYSEPDSYTHITKEDTETLCGELAALMPAGEADPNELRFDALMYGAELAVLEGRDTRRYSEALSNILNAMPPAVDTKEDGGVRGRAGKLSASWDAAAPQAYELEALRVGLRGYVRHMPESVLRGHGAR